MQRLEGPDGTIGRENIVRMLTVNEALKRTTLKRIELAIAMNDENTQLLFCFHQKHCLASEDLVFFGNEKKNTFTDACIFSRKSALTLFDIRHLSQ